MKLIAIREYKESYEIDVMYWFRKRTYWRYTFSSTWYKDNGEYLSNAWGLTRFEKKLNAYLLMHEYNRNKKLINDLI